MPESDDMKIDEDLSYNIDSRSSYPNTTAGPDANRSDNTCPTSAANTRRPLQTLPNRHPYSDESSRYVPLFPFPSYVLSFHMIKHTAYCTDSSLFASNYRCQICISHPDANRSDNTCPTGISRKYASAIANTPKSSPLFTVGLLVDKAHYIHRVGRTGHKGKEGQGILLLTSWEQFFISTLKDLPISKAELPLVDSDTKKKVEKASSNMGMKNKESAYQALFGYYNLNKTS
ncbi:DEAD-box ATP-dependent RNA helicase 31-like protein [Tanacetum coccineum]|uniref:DEAD-box ATP-dependent RNA helicase 31-like protein n=1 Tax=Tanacetum coccineum TaxID=301880 RepID=A0ABQ5H4A0_9ASTR